jgi:hypothetical protein
MLVSVAQRMPELLSVYRTGEGLDWAAYGPEMWQGQAALNRPLYVTVLGQDYLSSIPELDAILSGPTLVWRTSAAAVVGRLSRSPALG